MRDYKAELKQAIERRDYLVSDMESRKKLTVSFIKAVSDELTILERNITNLTTCVELESLRDVCRALLGGEMIISDVIKLAEKTLK